MAAAGTGQAAAMSDPDATLGDESVRSVPLEDEDGDEYVIGQQNQGRGDTEGSGEWPSPGTPPRAPAPGSAED